MQTNRATSVVSDGMPFSRDQGLIRQAARQVRDRLTPGDVARFEGTQINCPMPCSRNNGKQVCIRSASGLGSAYAPLEIVREHKPIPKPEIRLITRHDKSVVASLRRVLSRTGCDKSHVIPDDPGKSRLSAGVVRHPVHCKSVSTDVNDKETRR